MNARAEPDRPNPDALLRKAAQEGHGRLKVFLGAAPGVGKTYEMLTEAQERRRAGVDVVVGIVETHGRAETEAQIRGLEIIPRRQTNYHGRRIDEMDIDAILARAPRLVLVDELAHTNAPGSRHEKRYQDVEELLAAGIDVYSTVNVQHLESVNDVVASFTKVRVRETLPDRVIENADIEVIDIPPDELIERLKQGKVYVPEEASRALDSFFSKSNLTALRELALRRTAQAIDAEMLEYVRANALAGNWAAGERMVVAVSELPGAAELVRAAKRLADAWRGSWTAVHIETPRSGRFTDAENAQLAATLHLASQLGAQVATVPAESVVEGLARFATEARATQLIVGKSTRSRWFELRHGSVVDRLVREMPGIAVHVLPMQGHQVSHKGTRKPAEGKWGQPGEYLIAFALVSLVALLGAALSTAGNIANAGLLFLLPVMIAALRYGLRVGVATSLVASLAYNFFFLPPTHTFTIQDPQNILTVLVLLAVAVTSSQLAARVRDQALLAQRSAAQNSSLAGFARQLTAMSDPDDLSQLLCTEVSRLLRVNTVLLMTIEGQLAIKAAVPAQTQLEALEQAASRWSYDHNLPAGHDTETLTASDWQFRPLAVTGRVLGVIGLSRADAGSPVRSDQLPMLLSLLDQAALAFQRAALEEEMAFVAQLKERDRLRSALLSSVSHDLRTPLTTILGALGAMHPSSVEEKGYLSEARNEAERLNRFVGNLLDMARIEAGALRQLIEPVDLTEAIAAAVHDLRRTLGNQPIDLQVPPDLPFVMVDPQLFHHCLINLIENAAKHGGPKTPITVMARRTPAGLTLSVIDKGAGIPEGAESRIFETFERIEGSDRKGGSGLGLAIVKGFAEAMGLDVSAANRPETGGACFSLHFPEARLVKGSTEQ
ncbi:two-component histidine kinase KdpD [Caenibius tardaugens NBRC 16725]|uniref:histidine kinase n=1 Tax=Caenibius tardaugens NBRC 16725 TaxID=1219035 RepID=U2ZYI5_9SPHN|nr:sensor histidine kinase KdpD [Caenibius tardaugens]AZI37169.1 sensor histidine kinase KdpD [Caenibius tardaugens NBRC 16725]GAD47588.1 two-component histidine kinase KdpD [Caenibius tardaugens NBRC 16725]